MKRTKAVVLITALWLLVYEAWTLFNDTANDTISHAIVDWFYQSPWLQYGLTGAVLMVLGHWLWKWWPWKRPFWKDDPTTPEDESLRNKP